jgi:murein L,D-transpeptidase YafK
MKSVIFHAHLLFFMRNRKVRLFALGILFFISVAIFFCKPYLKRIPIVHTALLKLRKEETVGGVLSKYEGRVDDKFIGIFGKKGMKYPPKRLIILCFKKEMTVEVYVSADEKNYTLVEQYPILAPSGTLGPKTLEGDMQIPEGIYKIEFLNPNSRYHLSMKINYPNEFERKKAEEENRIYPGSDIFIHGSNASIGCVSIGDGPIEDIFVLAAKTKIQNVAVIISPYDFRKTASIDIEMIRYLNPEIPTWSKELYRMIETKIREIKFQNK